MSYNCVYIKVPFTITPQKKKIKTCSVIIEVSNITFNSNCIVIISTHWLLPTLQRLKMYGFTGEKWKILVYGSLLAINNRNGVQITTEK